MLSVLSSAAAVAAAKDNCAPQDRQQPASWALATPVLCSRYAIAALKLVIPVVKAAALQAAQET